MKKTNSSNNPLFGLSFDDFLSEIDGTNPQKAQDTEVEVASCKCFDNMYLKVEALLPEYSSYTTNDKGFTIYFNITNITRKPVKLELKEVFLLLNNQKQIPDYNFQNHRFPSTYFFPNSTRTFGKIWVTDKWGQKQLKRNDIVQLDINDTNNSQILTYVFLLEAKHADKNDLKWVLLDYQVNHIL